MRGQEAHGSLDRRQRLAEQIALVFVAAQALERLVRLYEAKGDEEQAATWRKELESRRTPDGGRR